MTSHTDRETLTRGNNIPPILVGKWKVQGSPYQYEITATGGYHVIGTPKTYSFQDSNTLNWHVSTYTRIYGSPNSLIGVWWLEEHKEEVTFRDNNTYSSYWSNGELYTGTYIATSSHITTNTLALLLNIDGTRMTMIKPYDLPIPGSYEIESSKRWHFRPDNGDDVTYYKD